MTSKAIRLLLLLLSKPGETFNTDQILSAVWGDDQEATESTLRQHMVMLRHALEDSVTQRYIATDYGRGYRFLGEISAHPPPYMAAVVEQYCAAAAEFQRSGSPAGMMAALHLYDRALAIDDSSAAALGGAALTRVLMADFQYDRPRELLEIAHVDANAALAADPDCIEGVIAICKVTLDYFWNFRGALELAQRALQLNSNHRIAVFMYAWILALSSRWSEAKDFIDSLSPTVAQQDIILTCRGVATLFSGDYDAAIAELGAVCRRWPEYWFARTFHALGLIVIGKIPEALHILDQVRHSEYDSLADRQMNARYFAEGYALYARFRLADIATAESDLKRLKRAAESRFIPATIFALAELGRDNYPGALTAIRQCRDNRECWYTHLGVDPLVKDLRLEDAGHTF